VIRDSGDSGREILPVHWCHWCNLLRMPPVTPRAAAGAGRAFSTLFRILHSMVGVVPVRSPTPPSPLAGVVSEQWFRDSVEGTDEGGEAAGPGLLDAGPGCYHHAAEEGRSMIRAQSAPVPRVSIERVSNDLSLILPNLEQEAHAPSRRGSGSSRRSAADNDRKEVEECSTLRADCWDVRWGAVGARAEGQSPDTRSLCEQRVHVHVMRLFSISDARAS